MSKELVFLFATLIVVYILFSISNALTPFIISITIAYLLNPVVDRLSLMKLPRSLSSMVIILLFFVCIFAFIFFITPLLYSQFTHVLKIFPDYLVYIQKNILPKILDNEVDSNSIKSFITEYSSEMLNFTKKFVNNIWSSTIAIINILSLIFITPIITFYILRDWPSIVNSIDRVIPRKHYPAITKQLSKIDCIISAYIRGQTQVCLILSFFYSICLYFTGLQYSLFIGLFTGIFSFIPYVGFAIGFTIGNIISFFQFNSITMKLLILLIFIAGQILENAFITPKLIGDNVKLHPVWVIFAIFAGGIIFGFIGVLVAVPVAAVVGVLFRFFLEHYFQSNFYETTKLNR